MKTKIPRPQPRDLLFLELFAMFANLIANGARILASGLAGSRTLAVALQNTPSILILQAPSQGLQNFLHVYGLRQMGIHASSMSRLHVLRK